MLPIAAFIIASISLITTIILGTKNYRKSKRLEFFQRRDHLFQKISDLNSKNSDARLISARYEMVAQNLVLLKFNDAKQAERIRNQIISIRRSQQSLELRTKYWNETIEQLYSFCNNLSSNSDAAYIEKLIGIIQLPLKNFKRDNESFLASLHILESTEPLLKADLDKLHKHEEQLAELNLQKAMKELDDET